MHQIRFQLGLGPRPRWRSLQRSPRGAYSAPPDPLAGLRGPTSKGREGKEGKGRRGKGREGEWRSGKGREEGERGGVSWIYL